jgi:hypothetical protein
MTSIVNQPTQVHRQDEATAGGGDDTQPVKKKTEIIAI